MKNNHTATSLTRPLAAVLGLLQEQPDPVGVIALSAVTGRHPNTLREHLDRLVNLGLVARHRALSEGRGRPAWLYEAVGPRPGEADHAELAAALAWSLGSSGDAPAAGAQAAGRTWGRHLTLDRGAMVQPTTRAAREHVVAMLHDLGFEPSADDAVHRVRLTRCPLLQAAHVNQIVVCAMHQGLVQGALEQYGGESEGVELVPFAEPGACLLMLPVEAAR